MARTPTRTQASMARPKSGTSLATAYGFLKTPEPMTVPMTMAVAIHGPSTRGKCDGLGAAEVAVFMAMSVPDGGAHLADFLQFSARSPDIGSTENYAAGISGISWNVEGRRGRRQSARKLLGL